MKMLYYMVDIATINNNNKYNTVASAEKRHNDTARSYQTHFCHTLIVRQAGKYTTVWVEFFWFSSNNKQRHFENCAGIICSLNFIVNNMWPG